MSNACYFEMMIAGDEPAVMEFAKMVEEGGLGRVTAFELNQTGSERDYREASAIALTGSGSCIKSVRASMIANDGPVDLHSETERLGLVVEVFSAEPSTGFQEHLVMDKGDLTVDEITSYQEIYVDWTEKEDVRELMSELGLTELELEAKVNEYGELWIGGFENYGTFQDPFPLLSDNRVTMGQEASKESLDDLRQQAKDRASEKNLRRSEEPKTARTHDLDR